MDWFQVMVSATEAFSFQSEFISCFISAGSPLGLCLFQPKDDKAPGWDSTYYLPPLATQFCPELLKKYNALRCEKPPFSNVSIHGTEEDFNYWYPFAT